MKYFFLALLILWTLSAQSQTDSASEKTPALVSVHHPVPIVRNLMAMDSVSLYHYHYKYVAEMTSGTVLLGGGALIIAGHILSALLPVHINRPLTISLGSAGLGSLLSGAVVLAIGRVNQRHYLKAKHF